MSGQYQERYEYFKQYKEKNHERLQQKRHEYYEEKKDKLQEQTKKWKQDNPVRLREQKQEHFEKNQDKIHEYRRRKYAEKKAFDTTFVVFYLIGITDTVVNLVYLL
jgi:hypothetical protein